MEIDQSKIIKPFMNLWCSGYRLPYTFFVALLMIGIWACQPSGSEEKEVLYFATDFTAENEFTSGIEGPAVDSDGNLYAVNFEGQGTIGKVNPQGKAALFLNLPEGSTGNGIRINNLGDLFVADYTGHNVLKINPTNRKITVFAHSDSMNQPNDLAISKRGYLFASDPNWGEKTGNLWRIAPNGAIQLLEADMGTTNGVELSPDEKTLYVNESEQRKVWAYELSPRGEISNKRLFTSFPDFGMDGMRCDIQGNLYITRYGKGTVVILSPEGEKLNEVKLKGTKPSNITFGGPDGRTCFVSLQDRGCFEKFRVDYPGRGWKMVQ